MNNNTKSKYRITMKDFGALSFDVIVRETLSERTPPSVGAADSLDRRQNRNTCRRDVRSSASRLGGEEASESVQGEHPGGQGRRARILIVDDTPGVRDSLAKVLRGEGYDVKLAANGAEALETFQPTTTDLVLLDLDMPVRNGWEAFEQMIASKPDQAVIIITGKAEPASWSSASGPGIIVEKPIDVPLLLSYIKQVLDVPKLARQARIDMQRTLTRHTRPLRDASRWQAHSHGGLNE